MTQLLAWVGFSAVAAVIVVLAVWAIVWLIEATLRKSRLLNIFAQRMWAFYSSLPSERAAGGYAGCVVLYDFTTGKFGSPIFVRDNGMTDEEYASYVADMKAQWTRKTEVSDT